MPEQWAGAGARALAFGRSRGLGPVAEGHMLPLDYCVFNACVARDAPDRSTEKQSFLARPCRPQSKRRSRASR
jgi:hypothetical protein